MRITVVLLHLTVHSTKYKKGTENNLNIVLEALQRWHVLQYWHELYCNLVDTWYVCAPYVATARLLAVLLFDKDGIGTNYPCFVSVCMCVCACVCVATTQHKQQLMLWTGGQKVALPY